MAISFIKKGADSAAAAKQEAVEQKIRKESQGKMFRFWIKTDEEAVITFVDGELSPEGFLLPPRFYEHNIKLNGQWGNTFVCPEKSAPHLGQKCPFCAMGDHPSLVSLFTIIDHREYKSQDGQKTYKDQRRLFVAKTGTMEILNKIAVKRGGLAGCRFDVSRTGDKTPSVGTMFDFVSKEEDLDVLRKLYMREHTDPKTNAKSVKTDFEPANYDEEIPFYDAEQLAEMGHGAPSVSGYTMTVSKSSGTETVDYSTQL